MYSTVPFIQCTVQYHLINVQCSTIYSMYSTVPFNQCTVQYHLFNIQYSTIYTCSMYTQNKTNNLHFHVTKLTCDLCQLFLYLALGSHLVLQAQFQLQQLLLVPLQRATLHPILLLLHKKLSDIEGHHTSSFIKYHLLYPSTVQCQGHSSTSQSHL